jgi:PKD repeat protein
MIIISSLLIMGALTHSVSAIENLPTVWVKIYRIQAVDTIENFLESEADWRYTITVSDGETLITREFKCPSNIGNIIVDRLDSFPDIKNQDVFVTITLYEDDVLGHDTADISSSGTAFDCTYNLATNELGGDETVIEEDYYKTSGDYDGSLQTDENDANLWFAIFDNYDAPVANAGKDQSVYTGEKVNFDSSLSTASEGSSIVRFEWDFENDGVIDAEGENTSYTYNRKGAQTCRLVVTDSIGVMSEDTCLVNVLNRSPKAEFTFSPINVTTQDEMNMTDISSDPDGSIILWLWDFSDGDTSELQAPTHKFATEGNYSITLTVTDNDNATDTYTTTISVIEPLQAENVDVNSLWVIAALVISIAAIGFLAMLWLNRRKQSFPEMFTGSSDPVDFLRAR